MASNRSWFWAALLSVSMQGHSLRLTVRILHRVEVIGANQNKNKNQHAKLTDLLTTTMLEMFLPKLRILTNIRLHRGSLIVR